MEFRYEYVGTSRVAQNDNGSALSFVPDVLRPPTSFRGRVRNPLVFREAMSALHEVVTSDLRFQPKDRTTYLAWRATQSDVDLAAVARERSQVARDMERLIAELRPLEAESHKWRAPFYEARAKYWKWLYEKDRELWFKLDPVITVHPDEVFFECFSRDESSYGRLAARYGGFEELGERACGTTNVDYSDGLYTEFQKLRSYKHTSLDVDPAGFGVATTGEAQHREVKIDVPESWVRGFLQVSSAATLPATVVDLHPMDVHNVCSVLRRNKELFGPRSLRYRLRPGEPVTIFVDPWGIEVRCPRSVYQGEVAKEIRVWGRRRLHILERLVPHAKRVRVHLLGDGQPSFYVVDLGELSFTLGLSGWTHNNWSASSNFDLMAAREDVDDGTRRRVFDALGEQWLATPQQLASQLGLDTPTVASALGGWVQAGRAIYDLERGVYRKRELTREPLPVEKLRFASAREEGAAELLHRGKVAVDSVNTTDGTTRLEGRVQLAPRVWKLWLALDPDRRLVAGECQCDWFVFNKLRKGPCEHMLALRSAHRRGISDAIVEIAKPAPPSVAAAPVPIVFPAAPPAPTPEPTLAPKPSFWNKVAAFFKGKPAETVPADRSPEERLRAAVADLRDRGELEVSDMDALVRALLLEHGAHAAENARLFALVAAVKHSQHVARAPSDQTVIDALRRALS